MIKIAVITPTCRENPRLSEMARTLHASLVRADSVGISWIVVDERDPGRVHRACDTLAPTGHRFTVMGISPLPSPHRSGNKNPAHNSARMAGVLEAYAQNADYLVFLNDCNVVTMDWAAVARDVALKGVGWKCKTHHLQDLAVPEDGLVRMKDHHDLLRPVPHLTVAGACWGVPSAAFEQIGGFDLAYDGQRKGNDVDAIVRLSRIGMKFVTCERAYTVQLRRTKHDNEVSTNKEAFLGHRNQKLLNELLRSPARTTPIIRANRDGSVARPILDLLQAGTLAAATPVAKAKPPRPRVLTQAPRAPRSPRLVRDPAAQVKSPALDPDATSPGGEIDALDELGGLGDDLESELVGTGTMPMTDIDDNFGDDPPADKFD